MVTDFNIIILISTKFYLIFDFLLLILMIETIIFTFQN